MLIGLFVAYLDRTNLSVSLPQLSKDMGFAGDSFAVTSSWALTIFLIGYALANIFGGIATRQMDPKPVVIWLFRDLVDGDTGGRPDQLDVAILLVCRLILGVAEGIYWPQQSRFARAWFSPQERTRANSIIQYYGQFLALAVGFMVLTPIYDAFGWRVLFFLTGGIGLVDHRPALHGNAAAGIRGALSAADPQDTGRSRWRTRWPRLSCWWCSATSRKACCSGGSPCGSRSRSAPSASPAGQPGRRQRRALRRRSGVRDPHGQNLSDRTRSAS